MKSIFVARERGNQRLEHLFYYTLVVIWVTMVGILCLLVILNSVILGCWGAVAHDNPSPELNVTTSNVTGNDTMETQTTICRISSDRIIADAEATVTKVLSGGCNAKVMDDRLTALEGLFTHQLAELKHLILRVIEREDNIEENSIKETTINHRNSLLMPDYVKKLQKIEFIEEAVSPRQYEIEHLNDTIHELSTTEGLQRVYTHYWKVTDLKEKLVKWRTGRSLRSPTFYIDKSGYAMYMKFTPKYFPDGTVFISVGITRGSLDQHLVWPFPLKLQIEILDHSPEYAREDRRSRLWDPATVCSTYFWGQPSSTGDPDNPECVGLSTARKLFTTNNKFMWNDNIIIKLIVHL
ncbi:uncharacterized protein LOC135162745 isoform X2 [Diachasmimorpha longicaudata]|uniref:uncharacterized protein LOC135162745 isoform X2 n=1 Tax=Diachasmimorpha longicaudata TaxID=58733 RepID=UPI0030B871C3